MTNLNSINDGPSADDRLSPTHDSGMRIGKPRPTRQATSCWLSLVLCSFLCFQSTRAQECTLCIDGSDPPNVDLRIDGATCQALAESVLVGDPDPATCVSTQVTYGVYCGCPDPMILTTCRICGDDLLPVPGLSIALPSNSTDADTCLELEYTANINSNTDAELSCVTSQAEFAPLCCVDAPTATPVTTNSPSPVPTFWPTMAPSPAPTNKPTGTPSVRPTSISTTTIPTTSSLNTSSPTTSSPTTSSPTIAEESTNSPTVTAPTRPPTTMPTRRPVFQVGASFTGITLSLPGVQRLNENAQDNFESALQGWYASIYERDALRQRRYLQQRERESLRQFQTRVLYVSQSEEEGTEATVVTYDQTVSFVQAEDEEAKDIRQILLDPFEDMVAVRHLLDRLKVSDPFFESVDGDAFEAPDVPPPDDNSSDESGGPNLGLVIGVAAGGLVLLAIVLYVITKPFRRDEGTVDVPVKSKVGEEPSDERHPAETDEEETPNELATEIAPSPGRSSVSTPTGSQPEADKEHENNPIGKDEYPRARPKSPGPGPDEDDASTPLVSRPGGGVRHDTSSDTASWMGLLGLESSASDTMGQEMDLPEETYEVIVPPGKLGVVIDTPSEGPPTVFAVKNTSPLHGKIEVGDFLIQVDDEDVSTFSAVKVSKLIGRKAKNPERRFVMSRTLPKFHDK